LEEEFLEIFIEESADIISDWEELVMSLSPGEPANLDALFRMAHNLKGASRSVGLLPFGDYIHQVEDIITIAKEDNFILTEEIIHFFLDCQTIIAGWLEKLRDDPKCTVDISSSLQQIEALKKEFSEDGGSDTPPEVQPLGTIAIEQAGVDPEDV
jgi:two-component system, chemotaxis family, sensor kinase CheA